MARLVKPTEGAKLSQSGERVEALSSRTVCASFSRETSSKYKMPMMLAAIDTKMGSAGKGWTEKQSPMPMIPATKNCRVLGDMKKTTRSNKANFSLTS